MTDNKLAMYEALQSRLDHLNLNVRYDSPMSDFINSPLHKPVASRIVHYTKVPWWKFWAKPKPIREITFEWKPRHA